MFKNVGESVKGMAVLFLILGILGSGYLVTQFDSSFIVTIAVVGIIASVFIALLVYGFGQLIIYVEDIRKELDETRKILLSLSQKN